MDLGISGTRAIVCAASKGLGKGCAMALAGEGVDLVINARGAEALEATAAEIRGAQGVEVTAVAGDIADAGVQAEVSQSAALSSPVVVVASEPRRWGKLAQPTNSPVSVASITIMD